MPQKRHGRLKTDTVKTFNEEEPMVKIVVVCAAGASSTFLARRLSVLSSAAGLEWDVTPASGEGIQVGVADIVAVNFHVATPTLRDALIAQGARVVVFPEGVSGTFGAESAMATLCEFVEQDAKNSDSADEPNFAGSSRS
jgi:PTS system cellobiose-specific IIB component